MASAGLVAWTIFDHPNDFPDCFVARMFIGEDPQGSVICSTSIELLREEMRRRGLICIPREAEDAPKIVETWL